MKRRFCLFVAASAVLYAAPGIAPAADPVVTDSKVITEDRRLAIVQWKLASLQKQVELLEDAKAIERLQQAYGYYISEGLGSEAAALFCDSPAASIELILIAYEFFTSKLADGVSFRALPTMVNEPLSSPPVVLTNA